MENNTRIMRDIYGIDAENSWAGSSSKDGKRHD